ncbi:tyrosine-type recombinase/integrase [Streptomyces sp. S186]|uniref:tyrosine-type recombinase/integrase n=1 Tax=Streptomyces sp. S186 TaxID=3434395 RepID=UPI003F67EB5A
MLPLHKRWWPAMSTRGTIREAVDLVAHTWQKAVEAGAMSPQTEERFTALVNRFARFSSAHGVEELANVDTQLAAAFIGARGRSRHGQVAEAAIATQRLRRSVLRCFFRTARHLLLADADPVMDVTLPPRPERHIRPLEDEEADLVRHFAQLTEAATRHAATCALALCGLGSGEISDVLSAHVDLDHGFVDAPGTARTRPRRLTLDPWAKTVLARRISLLAHPHLPMVGTEGGSPAQRQARVCTTLRDVLIRAGLGDDPSLRPASITAHPALAAFRATGRIEDAARVLGIASLDRTAELIGYCWQVPDTASPRNA